MNIFESYVKYNKDYKIDVYLVIVFVLIFFSIYILFNYNYKTFYNTYGIITKVNDEYYLVVSCDIENNKYIINNNTLIIDNKKFPYEINKIDSELKIENNNNYQIFYFLVKLDKKYLTENLIVKVKILKEDKPLIKYLF